MTKSILSFTADDVPEISGAADGNLFDSLIWQESRGRQTDAKGAPVTSKKGAIGIAQVMPNTAPEAAALAGLPFDDVKYRTDLEYNKAIGRAYFNKQLETFGDPAKALGAYNAGPGAMRRALDTAVKAGNPDAWMQYLPAETQAYIPSILKKAGATSGSGPDAGQEYYKPSTTKYATLPPPVPARSAFEAAADAGLALASGVVAGAGLIANVAGADNPVAQTLDGAAKSIDAMSSPARKAQVAARGDIINRAEQSGDTWEELKAYGGAFLEAPIETVLNAVGTSAPTLLMGLIPGLGQVQAARLIAQGAIGAAQGAGSVKGAIYDAVTKRLIDGGMNPEEAQKVAAGAQAYDSVNGGNIAVGALLGIAAGTTGAEPAIARIAGGGAAKAGEAGLLKRVGKGVLAESPVEGLQDFQERTSSNIALQNKGFNVPTTQGAFGQAALAALASAPMGATAGAFDKHAVPPALAPVADAAAQPDSPLARAAVAGNTGPAADAARAKAAASSQPVDPAARLKELEAISKGGPNITNADGVTVPGAPGRIFTAQEQAEYKDLKARQATSAEATGVDPLSEKAARISDAIREQGALDALRSEDAPVDAKDVLKDLAIAQSKSTPAARREQALNRLEFALAWAGIHPAEKTTPLGTNPDPEKQPAGITPADRRAAIDAETTPRAPAPPPEGQVYDSTQAAERAAAADKELQQDNVKSSAKPAPLPDADSVMAALKVIPALRRAEQSALVRTATARYSAEDMAILEKGANYQAGLSATEKIQLDRLRGTANVGIVGPDKTGAAPAAPAVTAAAPSVPNEQIATPQVSTPPGAGTAVLRKRRAVLAQVVDLGLNRVERRGDEYVLTNGKKDFKLEGAADAQLARKAIQDAIRAGAEQANTEQTAAQALAGNYKKGRVEFDGLKLGIENPVGTERKDKANEPPKWSTKMELAHYGDVTGTTGADGDGVDVYLVNNPRAGSPVFVIDQYKGDAFDETKSILGVATEAEALRIYDAGFSDGSGPSRRRAVTKMTVEEFKKWAFSAAAEKPAGSENGKTGSAADGAGDKGAGKQLPDIAGGVAAGGDGKVRPARANGNAAAGKPDAGGAKPAPAGDGGGGSNVTIQVDGKPVTVQTVGADELGAESSAREGRPGRKITKQNAELLQRLATMFGKEVVFFKDPFGEIGDGFVEPGRDRTIFLNESSGISPLAVFGHELLHQVERSHPEIHEAIKKVVVAHLGENAPHQFRNDYHGRKAGPNSNAPLDSNDVNELVSDLGGGMLSDAKFWREVFAQIETDNPGKSKGLIARLADLFYAMVDRLVAGIKQTGYRAGKLDVDANSNDFINDMKAVRAAFRDGLSKYIADVGITRTSMQAEILRAGQDAQRSKTRDDTIYWHGSPSGDLRGGSTGLHLGTKLAATQALEARIGVPAEGGWDGTREYGKTLLAGSETLKRLRQERGHYLDTGANARAPQADYYPHPGKLKYSDGSVMPMDVKPSVKPFRLNASMTNAPHSAHDDFKANGYMSAAKKRGNAKSGYYYKNVAEDEGSISVVVPDGSHVTPVDDDEVKRSTARESVTNTPEFKEWFGDSQVVDEDGNPMVVYHATGADDFTSFEQQPGSDFGFHFGTADAARERFDQLSDVRKKMGAARTIPVYLSIQNPLRMPDVAEWNFDSILEYLGGHDIITKDEQFDALDAVGGTPGRELIADILKEHGYDGIVYINKFEAEGSESWIAFNPQQIKSATGNNGDFDANSGDITRSPDREPETPTTGIHFSKEPRTRLDGAYYGRGMKGFESKRLQNTDDQRLKERVYVYIDEGKGVRPEDGVGSYAHEVKLPKLYDAQENPNGLWKGSDLNATESAILDAGYGGYYVRDIGNNQGAAVVLGEASRDLKVKQLPDYIKGAAPAPAPATEASKALMSKELAQLDVSRIPGARVKSGTLTVPLDSVQEANEEMARINSDIRFSKTRETDEDFEESSIVDSDGNLVTLYHGTAGIGDQAIEEFRLGHGLYGAGIYLTEYPNRAEAYAIGDRGHVYPVKASITNPYDADDFLDRYGKGTKTKARANEIRDELIAEGYDGIVDRSMNKFWEVIAFHPEQIKFALDIPAKDIQRSRNREGLKPEIVETAGQVLRYLTPAERVKLRRDTAQTLVDIFKQLPSGNEMAAVAFAGKAKRGWYHNSARAIEHVFGHDAPRFAALLAAMSPQTSVEVNLRNALSTWKNWVEADRPTSRGKIFEIMGRSVEGSRLTDSVLPAWVPNSVRALTAEDPTQITLSGPKVNSFMLNLRGVVEEVTNDAWMANYAAVDQRIFSGSLNAAGTDPGKGPGYMAMSAKAREAARKLTQLTGDEWSPAEVQETVWSWAKTLYELQSKDVGARELLDNKAVTDDLIASTPDFSSQLHEAKNEETLKRAGYGEQLGSLRSRADLAAARDQESTPSGQAGPFDPETQDRLERRAASRLEQLRDDRAAAEAVTRADNAQRSTARESVTETSEFKAWFKGSKVVDVDGKPLVVYHGTATPGFSEFDPKQARSEGGAFFFSHSSLMKNPATNANGYATRRGGAVDDGAVMPVYLRMTNPLIAGFTEPMPEGDEAIVQWLDRMQKFNRKLDANKNEYYQRTIKEAKRNGHDGVIFKNVEDERMDGGRRWNDETDVYAAFRPEQIKSATGNRGTFDPKDADITRSTAREDEPLPGAPRVVGATGPDQGIVDVANAYAAQAGVDLKRQAEYVQVDEALAKRIADAYEAMEHAPQDPKVKAAYADLIAQTRAQYDALSKAGYTFTFFDGATDPYAGNPWNAMRDLRANKSMAVYGTYAGFGVDQKFNDNPMLEGTGLRWKDQAGVEHDVTANDLFRAVHDAFGHGLEGAGFRAQGEENAWQAHVRLFTGPAVGAITSETRGQNSWLNYGPHGEKNRTAKIEDTVFADQKTGLMPEWTWTEGRAEDAQRSTERDMFPEDFAKKTDTVPTAKKISSSGETAVGVNVNSNGAQISSTKQGLENFWSWFGDSDAVDEKGRPQVYYHTMRNDFDKFEAGRTTKNSGTFGDWDTTRSATFFTDDKEDSQEYAKIDGEFRNGANVMPVYLRATNPLDMVSGYYGQAESIDREFEKAGLNPRWLHQFDWSKFDDEDGKAFVEAAKKIGYDSVIFWDEIPGDDGEMKSFKTTAIFEPEQIKSATGNRGTFDSGSDITRSTAREDAFAPDQIEQLLDKDDWAIMTAENPAAKQSSAADNASAMDALRADLRTAGARFQEVRGKYGNEENSLAITGIDEAQAIALGKKYGQESVLTRKGLVYQDGSITPATGITKYATAPDDFYSKIGDTIFSIGLDFDVRVTPQDVKLSKARDDQYEGHLNDGSSVQKHSAGGLYPYVVVARDAKDGQGYEYGLIGPDTDGYVWIGSWEKTTDSAIDRKVAREQRNAKRGPSQNYQPLRGYELKAEADKLRKLAIDRTGHGRSMDAKREIAGVRGALNALSRREQKDHPNVVGRYEDRIKKLSESVDDLKKSESLRSQADAFLNGRPQSDNAKRSTAREPIFYSQLELALESVPDRLATMAAPQWKLWLDANAPKFGVKKEEIEWSGLPRLLKVAGTSKITRDEIVSYLQENAYRSEAIRMYSDGGTLESVGRALGLGQTRIHSFVTWAGINRTAAEARGVTSEVMETVRQLYRDGASLAKVQAKVGLSQATIHKIVSQAGESRSLKESRALDQELRADAAALYALGLNIREVAEQLGIGDSTVGRIIASEGVSRGYSDAQALRRMLGRKEYSRGIQGAFESQKGGGKMYSASIYELARMHQLEADDTVSAFKRSPDRIPYGAGKTYNPDFEVETADGGVRIEEVKPLAMLKDELVRTKALAALDFYKKQGKSYVIVTERSIGPGGFEALSESDYPEVAPDRIRSALKSARFIAGEVATAAAPEFGVPIFSKTREQTTGNYGRQYTPEQLEFFKNTGRTTTETTLKERLTEARKGIGKKLAQGLVDQFRPLRDLGGNAYTLARLSKGAAGAFEALLGHGKLSIKDGAYDADNTGGFIDTVGKALGKEMEDFFWWIAANRADRLSKEDREHLFTDADIAGGKSLATGQMDKTYTLANGATTMDRAEAYADAAKKFDAFNKNVLDIAEQSGLIDGESRKIWDHEFYVPFYRVSEEDGSFMGNKIKGGLARQRAFKVLKGGSEKLNSDLLANTMKNWAHLIDASAKNRAARATLEAAQNMGLAVEANAETIKQMGKSMGEKGGAVWFMDHGVQRHFLVGDPYLLAAINSLEYAGLRGPLMDALSTMKHWLTVGVTASPAFKVRNLIRDSLQAIATSELDYNPITNLKKGIAATDRKSQDYVSALASGALIRFGTMAEGNHSERIRRLVQKGVKSSTVLDNPAKMRDFYDKFIEPAVDAYNELGNRGEEINRASLYTQLIAKGMNHAKASLMARDLMDFSMQGTWTSIRFLTQVVPFLNARLQGLYKLGRAAGEDPRRFAAVTGAVALMSIALLAAYHDDDDWKKREEFDRDGFWWFKLGGTAFRIPKPFEIGAIASVAERGAELLMNDKFSGKMFADRLKHIASDNLSMNPVPQAVKPLLDIYANIDSFSGRPIETMGMEKLRADYRFDSSTSMLARGASTAMNKVSQNVLGADTLSPAQIDHILRGYFGWLGTFVVGGADMAIRPLTNEPSRPQADYLKVLTQGFLRTLPEPGSKYVSALYTQAKQLEEAYATHRQLIKDGKLADARDFAVENKELLERYKRVEAVKETESALTKRIRSVERSDVSPAEKRAEIQKLRDAKSKTAERVY